ncbi:MAG: hypothetical protein QXW55_06285 [Candidatus Bathyarchaeia archaeon]
MRDKPIVYLPFGTLEWHGLHLALDRERYLMALNIQERIMSKARSIEEEGYAVLGSAEYETFIISLWSGKYTEAIKNGEALLLELRKGQKIF